MYVQYIVLLGRAQPVRQFINVVSARNSFQFISFHFVSFRIRFSFRCLASPRLVKATKQQQNIICLAFWLLRQSISVAPLAKYAINSIVYARILSTICVHSIIIDVPVCMCDHSVLVTLTRTHAAHCNDLFAKQSKFGHKLPKTNDEIQFKQCIHKIFIKFA